MKHFSGEAVAYIGIPETLDTVKDGHQTHHNRISNITVSSVSSISSISIDYVISKISPSRPGCGVSLRGVS